MKVQFRHLKYDIIWMAFAAIVAYMLIYPIDRVIYQYPFRLENMMFIFAFIVLLRYLFFLSQTILSKNIILKILFAVGSIPLFLFLMNKMSLFRGFLGDTGLDQFMLHLSDSSQINMSRYIRTEVLVFGVGSMIATAFIPFLMLVSIWRQINKGTD